MNIFKAYTINESGAPLAIIMVDPRLWQIATRFSLLKYNQFLFYFGGRLIFFLPRMYSWWASLPLSSWTLFKN